MTPLLLSLPMMIPLLGSLFARRKAFFTGVLFLQLFSCVFLLSTVLSEGTLATASGGWIAPYGIVIIADPFAALLLVAASVVFVCSCWTLKARGVRLPLLLLLQAGVALSFLSGDLFNLFVAFEILLISSYALVASEAEPFDAKRLYRYLSINILVSFLYLIAVAGIYAETGSLNLAALSMHKLSSTGPLWILLTAFFIKAGIFPLYFWLPEAYPLLPQPLASLFSGTLSKVGMYVLYRFLGTLFPAVALELQPLLLFLAAFTMALGVLGAVSKKTIQGILSYHILSQVGYMLFALALGGAAALAAGIFFILHNIFVKSSLFLVGGLAAEHSSKKALWGSSLLLCWFFMLQAFSLAGIPPLSGFWGKLFLFQEAVEKGAYITLFVALITSFFTLFSMWKIWHLYFLVPQENTGAFREKSSYISVGVLTLFALFMGFFAEPVYKLSLNAAQGVEDGFGYREAALSVGSRGERS